MSETDDNQSNPLFLIGFMGAGKTTVGKALAAKLSFDFVDLDDWIELRTGKTVPEIFTEFGEPYFRKMETESLKDCSKLRNTVISIGGGAYSLEENRLIIRRTGKTVWLDCSLDVVISRIQFDGTRPLARSREELRELLQQRIPAYSQADFTVQVDDKPIDQVVYAIQQLISVSDTIPSE